MAKNKYGNCATFLNRNNEDDIDTMAGILQTRISAVLFFDSLVVKVDDESDHIYDEELNNGFLRSSANAAESF